MQTSQLAEKPLYTLQGLIDEVFLHLTKVREAITLEGGKVIHIRKYYRQASELIYRIPIYEPHPAFNISLADLTPELIEELNTLPKNGLDYLLKEVASLFLENCDYNYFHRSAKKYTRGGLVA
jgi:hypothetical protein